MRRCDPQGRGIAAYFADEIARPLGLNFWIGLPHDLPLLHLARIDSRPSWSLPDVRKLPYGLMLRVLNPWSLTMRSLTNPRVRRVSDLDSPLFWHLEHPSTVGIGEVRAVARAYAEFAIGGARLGIQRDTLDAIESVVSPRADCST